jgi:hypothetical protein
MSESGSSTPTTATTAQRGSAGTVLDHPRVREYLRSLDVATASLPGPQARELHEQIVAHLDEALPPGASEQEVRAELHRLGSPRVLAREAEGPVEPPAPGRLGRRLRRVRWWAWTAIGTALVVIAAGVTVIQVMEQAQPLDAFGSGWLYRQDQVHAVNSTADLSSQTTVPERVHQQQGILLQVVNDSDWTQTILGTDPNWYASMAPFQVLVESGQDLNLGGSPLSSASFLSPGIIPPHSVRFVHLVWTSAFCMASGEVIINEVALRVRVGVVTRTEDIPLNQAFAIEGTKASAALCQPG